MLGVTTPRVSWTSLLAGAVVCAGIITVCVVAGVWQYGRYVDRADAVEQFARATELAPLEVRPGVILDETESWRTVVATGVLDPELTVLRNRPVDGSPAVHYLAWLDTASGWMLINLGYSAPGAQPPPIPTGPVTVSVTWRDWEEDDSRRGEGATRITPAQVAARTPAAQGYGMLGTDCAVLCSADLGLMSAPVPRLTTGPHLAYAWQWWGFAAFAPVGAMLLMRRERVPDTSPGAQRRTARATRPLSDEDVEDALWDDAASR